MGYLQDVAQKVQALMLAGNNIIVDSVELVDYAVSGMLYAGYPVYYTYPWNTVEDAFNYVKLNPMLAISIFMSNKYEGELQGRGALFFTYADLYPEKVLWRVEELVDTRKVTQLGFGVPREYSIIIHSRQHFYLPSVLLVKCNTVTLLGGGT